MRHCILLAAMLFTGYSTKSQIRNDGNLNPEKNYHYLALGDSYTIGESVPETERWPVKLRRRFLEDGVTMEPPHIIATTGWTTDELKKAIRDANTRTTYDLVSLLIGVNNQYRGYSFKQYKRDFLALLKISIALAGNKKSAVFVVSIPDYGVTPFGQKKNPLKIAREIDRYNSAASGICKKMGIRYINITDISRKAKGDPSLIADDGLHPSGKMYGEWVRRIYPLILSIATQ